MRWPAQRLNYSRFIISAVFNLYSKVSAFANHPIESARTYGHNLRQLHYATFFVARTTPLTDPSTTANLVSSA
jgi:hypothetical protein